MEHLLRIHLEELVAPFSAQETQQGATAFLRKLLREPRPVRLAVARDLETALGKHEEIARRVAKLPRGEAEALGVELLEAWFGAPERQSDYERLVEDLTFERTPSLEQLIRILKACAPAA